MDISDIVELIILVVLLVLSGFFSSAETALTTVSLNKLRTIEDEGGRRGKKAKLILGMREDSGKLLSAILIGNNVVNVAASSLTTVLCTKLFGSAFVGVAAGILTLLILIFGEITPKTLAAQYNVGLSMAFAKPIYFLMIIFTPIIWIVNSISGLIFKIFRIDPDVDPNKMTESELLKIVDVSSDEGVIETEERKMITNVVDFGDAIAKDIMIPRADMICFDLNDPISDLMEIIKEENYSRIPVYDESRDHVTGILHVKDMIFAGDRLDAEDFDVRELVREPVYVYEYQRTAEIFSDMKSAAVSMCIVLDEYGITAGLITMEDLIEEIVGDIRDEYDEYENELIKEISENRYDVDGSVKLDDLNDAIGTTLESDNYDSIGGLMIELLDRLPKPGDTVRTGEVTLKCLSVEKNRVERIELTVSY